MSRLDIKLDEAYYDDILAATEPSPLIASVKLAESQTPLKRGTVLVAASAGEQCKPASEALKDSDAIYILAETLEKAAADEVTMAFKAGHFIKERLVTDGEYELVAADFELLRKSGLQVQGMIEDPALEGV